MHDYPVVANLASTRWDDDDRHNAMTWIIMGWLDKGWSTTYDECSKTLPPVMRSLTPGHSNAILNVFVQMTKCIFPNDKMYFSKLQNVFVPIAKCICPNSKTLPCDEKSHTWQFKSYLEYICPNDKMYFFKWQNVFVLIVKCICSNWKMYLSK